MTGVNGFVGNHVAKELSDNGLEVIGVGGSIGTTNKSEYVSDYRVIDLMDAEAVQEIDFNDLAGVIHLAGLTVVGQSFERPLQYIETNVGIEVNLFETAQAQGARPKFIIVSSGTLYDPRTNLPVTENSPMLPNSPYAVSKFTQEQMAQYYASRGFEIVIARPFNHIGPGQNPGFIVPDIAQQIIAVEQGEANEIKVGNLDAKRDYTDVRDVARAYRLLLEKGKPGEIYNICSGTSHSGHEVLETLLREAGTSPTITQDPARMRPSDTPDIYGSHEKLSRDTDWQPEINIGQTLADVIADWRSR